MDQRGSPQPGSQLGPARGASARCEAGRRLPRRGKGLRSRGDASSRCVPHSSRTWPRRLRVPRRWRAGAGMMGTRLSWCRRDGTHPAYGVGRRGAKDEERGHCSVGAHVLGVPIGCLTASVRRAGCWVCRPRDRYPRLRPPNRMTTPRLCPSPIGASFCLCPVRVADETPAPPLCLVAEVGQGLFSVRPAVASRPQPGQWESALTPEFAV